jgi:hypothetical protein
MATVHRFVICAVFALSLCAYAVAQAQDLALTYSLTKDDIKNSDLGQEVVKLNDEIRQLSQDAQGFKKGSPSWRSLANSAAATRKERDRIGEPLRGLRGRSVTIHSTGISGVDIVNHIVRTGKRCAYAWIAKSGKFRCENYSPAPSEVRAENVPQPGIVIEDGRRGSGGPCRWIKRGSNTLTFGIHQTNEWMCQCGLEIAHAGRCGPKPKN